MITLDVKLSNNFKLAPDDYRGGRFENVDFDKKIGTVKIYSDLLNNSLSIGFQPSGVKHGDYKELGIIDFGPLYPKGFK